MKLSELVSEFLGRLDKRLGEAARPNGTFFAANVVSTALNRIRLDAIDGAALTEEGHRFVNGAAAYLSTLAAGNWHKRGLKVQGGGALEGAIEKRSLFVTASRNRDGIEESYRQDFLQDAYRFLIHLRMPAQVPYLNNQVYYLDSVVYPNPEYLYMFGVFLMQSPAASGNWPSGQTPGGLEGDFTDARTRLVDDLHKDIGLPLDDQALRALSWWVVFPPYGWQMNDGQSYNMMTLIDQIGISRTVSAETGESYLRALMRSQLLFLRNLAVRTLLVLGCPPRDERETQCYATALKAKDQQIAAGYMTDLRWQLEGRDPAAQKPEDWQAHCWQQWQAIAASGPTEAWRGDPIFSDPEYMQLGRLRQEQPALALAETERLLARDPGNWFLRSAYGAWLMEGPEPARGEQLLRACLSDTPGCPDAHFNLGTRLKWQGRRDEAMTVFEEAVRRWPHNRQAVDSCMWLLTDDMVSKPKA